MAGQAGKGGWLTENARLSLSYRSFPHPLSLRRANLASQAGFRPAQPNHHGLPPTTKDKNDKALDEFLSKGNFAGHCHGIAVVHRSCRELDL